MNWVITVFGAWSIFNKPYQMNSFNTIDVIDVNANQHFLPLTHTHTHSHPLNRGNRHSNLFDFSWFPNGFHKIYSNFWRTWCMVWVLLFFSSNFEPHSVTFESISFLFFLLSSECCWLENSNILMDTKFSFLKISKTTKTSFVRLAVLLWYNFIKANFCPPKCVCTVQR